MALAARQVAPAAVVQVAQSGEPGDSVAASLAVVLVPVEAVAEALAPEQAARSGGMAKATG